MGLFNAFMALSGAVDTDAIENERLARHTSYRIGGPAGLFLTCHSYHALRRATEVLEREGVSWVVIGKGSDLLVSDQGFDGAVITLGREFQRTVIGDDGVTVSVGSGVILARLVNDALSAELSGLEFAVGIPGSLGGAVSMNAGTRTEWIGALIENVVTYRPGFGIRRYRHDDVKWGYRSCGLPRDEIVLEATLRLAPGEKNTIRANMERYLSLRRRSQPLGNATCGSVFKNPPEKSVGKMIEDCGLKGFSIGGAQVSTIHANFIVNTGTARASEVAALIKHIHDRVRETYGIELQPEVKFLGF
ncbi:UDP-N-acetylmuramate dehydrogenase [Coriobacterium glomerans PW2]|uniref:UDP-N-acetylenolpyruvoylglucosamine reductase n=1 Tax=Coriobacterium glomerans (strain ATCC 49209 / DSM 20642 / JCM 10262 / PW2) TaxID=700015 RepID=F2NBR8_CORGP|nr:UDP-N-acetylmuramate dehydrogenase [Coriobacterium glomerans]AEB06877.1 UDP-N-acetylmuramate dehydrogenase [Coriobacterium glomerans PW2]